MVDHLHGGRRVVDRRRERLDRDVDHDPHGEGGILLDRPLDAEDDHPSKPVLVPLAVGLTAVDADHRRTGGNEVPGGVVEHERATTLLGEADEPRGVDRLDRAGTAGAHDHRRLVGELQRPAHDLGRVGSARRADGGVERAPARRGGDRRDGDRSQSMDESVEKEQEEEHVCGHQDAGHADADMRDGVLLDPRQQREGKGERPDQHRQQDLQDLVPVPEAHVAGRQVVRRHLDDEDADGDDEAGQRRRCPDDCRQQRARRRCRVLERERNRDPAGQDRLEQPEHGARDAAQQREEPEAPLQILARLEVERSTRQCVSYSARAVRAHHPAWMTFRRRPRF